MRFLNVILLAALAYALNACGTDCSGNSQQYQNECQKDPDTEQQPKQYFTIQGAVVGAFDVEVDGQSYSDIESFYTEERERLPLKIEDAGYYGYDVDLQAKLGFRDLTNGMSVYVSSSEKRGYAARSVVQEDDTFLIRFPEDAAGDTYKIRAIKRISIVLSNKEETLTFCYNFSALDTNVLYDEVDKPVVLSSFKTNITSYECPENQTGDNLHIPKNDAPEAESVDSEESSEVTL